MSRQYAKVVFLSEEILRRKAAGETDREIGKSYGLTKEQVYKLVKRQRRKTHLIASGYVPQPKGRPCKNPENEEQRRNSEVIQLRMQVELLRNFLSEAGRR
ncbi:hypothetical protein [Anaeromassilibacillus senegalensis]|uniref:hypothetical protein n=1 Tax=Anaeromassilibacillus senegalensis TaxID=1673717 RepID=UPI000682D629|nr:hypothetical protein [Anaeromassilibacillus senegalensis]